MTQHLGCSWYPPLLHACIIQNIAARSMAAAGTLDVTFLIEQEYNASGGQGFVSLDTRGLCA